MKYRFHSYHHPTAKEASWISLLQMFKVLVDITLSDIIERHKGRDRGPIYRVRRFMKMIAFLNLDL